MREITLKQSLNTGKRLDPDRLKSLVHASETWPAYRRAEMGANAPTKVASCISAAKPSTDKAQEQLDLLGKIVVLFGESDEDVLLCLMRFPPRMKPL